MTEYIFKPRCADDFELDERDKTNPVDWYGTLHGEIVRCRDCRYSVNDGDMCMEDCSDSWDWRNVEPDGFCAWACRKEGGDD